MKLEVKELCKNYGRKEALKSVSFSLTPGIYGLLGPKDVYKRQTQRRASSTSN